MPVTCLCSLVSVREGSYPAAAAAAVKWRIASTRNAPSVDGFVVLL